MTDTTASDDEATTTRVVIRPWIDPMVDDDGFDPRSRYVETFWLGTLGPTATWLIRRLVAGLERHPDGYRLDLATTARAMGLSYAPGRATPFSKALQRCVMFGLAHSIADGFAVRRRMPPLSIRHLQRMPEELRDAHAAWLHARVAPDHFDRAHRLATTMLDLGDDAQVIEHRLLALGIDEITASQVADPHELHNVIADPAYRAVAIELRDELARLQAELGDEPHPTATAALDAILTA